MKKDPTAKYFKTSDELIYMVDSFKFPIQFPLRTLARGVKVDLKKEWEEKAPTLILISAKRLGAAEMLDSWRVPFEKEFPHLNVFEVIRVILSYSLVLLILLLSHLHSSLFLPPSFSFFPLLLSYQFSQVDLVQQVGYWLLGPWLRRIARKQASPERWSKILYYNGIRKTKMWRFELEMKNRFVGYAYLVDKEGFIRWRASGIAQPEEITHMITATNKLIKQIARKKK